MSCSGEIIEEYDNDRLIQIKPAISQQLKKAKYGVADHSTVELCHWTKKSFKHEGNVTSTNFTGFRLIDVWNSLLQVCTVKIVVCIVGGQWNFTTH